MLGSPTFMSGASIWGCERRTPCISLLPGASMRPSLRLDRRLATAARELGVVVEEPKTN